MATLSRPRRDGRFNGRVFATSVICFLIIAWQFVPFDHTAAVTTLLDVQVASVDSLPDSSSHTTNAVHEFFVPSNPNAVEAGVLPGVTLRTRGTSSCRSKNAVVMLAQKKHSTYLGRDSLGLLVKTLDLFRDNYLKLQQHASTTDVFLFHTGDFDDADLIFLEDRLLLGQQSSQSMMGILRMVNLNNTAYWSLPELLRHDNPATWKGSDIYPVGYRHMCRWFGEQIWYFFQDLNNHNNNQRQRQQQQCRDSSYRYIARLDEDSFLLSPINYDIFDLMVTQTYVYGFRMCAYELEETLPKIWFKKWRKGLSSDNNTNKIVSNQSRQGRQVIDPGLCGFYTNFFVADLKFFLSPEVTKFLREIDRRGFFYRKRFGDLLVHSLAVYAFAPSTQIHRFLDFTYQHATIDYFKDREKECISWGSIQAGYNDPIGEQQVDAFHQKHVLGKDCPTANLTYLFRDDLSPTYSHLPERIRQQGQSFKLKTVYAGKVELPSQGMLSG